MFEKLHKHSQGLKKAIASDNEISSENLRILSLLFLLTCGIMSFFKYTHVGLIWDSELTFKPQLLSSIIAIILITPLYLRGILKWNKSAYSLISLILILLVFASFTELALGGTEKSPIVIGLLAAAVLLSWLGMSAVAGSSWLLAFGAGIYSAIENSQALGIYGFIYIVSGFIGLVLHSGLNPGEFIQGVKNEYSKTANTAFETVNSDVNNLGNKL